MNWIGLRNILIGSVVIKEQLIRKMELTTEDCS